MAQENQEGGKKVTGTAKAATEKVDATKPASATKAAADASPSKGDPGGDAGIDVDALIENARNEGYDRGFKTGKEEAESEFAAFMQDRGQAESGDDEHEDMGFSDDNSKMTVGLLAATAIRLPRSLRVGGIKPVLDNLTDFVGQFEGVERYIAADMILAVAETRPDEIQNGAYRFDIENAIKLIRGEPEAHGAVAEQREANKAAAARFAKLSAGKNPLPEAAAKEMEDAVQVAASSPIMDGDAGQNDAASRLYGRQKP